MARLKELFQEKITPQLRAGLALAWAHTQSDSRHTPADQRLKSDAWQILGYGTYTFSPGRVLDFQAGLGRASNEGSRHIVFAGATARSDYDSNIVSAGLGYSHALNTGATSVVPYARVDYLRVRDDAYTETGAGALNLHVNKATAESLLWRAGMKVEHPASEQLTLFGDASIGYDSINDRPGVTAAFAGLPGTQFATWGAKAGSTVGALGLGAAWKLGKNVELSGRYDVQARKHYVNQGLSLNLRAAF